MRRIVSRHKSEKLRRRNQWIIGFILIFLMFASVLGFAFQGGHGGNVQEGNGDGTNQNIVNYNGFQFENINGFWVWGSFAFANNPNQVEGITSSESRTADDYRDKILYVDSDSVGAESEIIVNLGQIVESIESVDDSFRNCEENILIIESSDQESITQENNCVFIRGSGESLIRMTDHFLFRVLGVK